MISGEDALESETFLDSGISPVGGGRGGYAPKVVLLTGGTGYLGAYAIADLLRLTDARLYCLVRAETDAAAQQRLLENLAHYGLSPRDIQSRLVAVAGDIESDKFNLDPATFDRLSEQVDTVYHLAASVSFMTGYEAIKTTNVTALQRILSFACTRRDKAVHYTSTYAVFNTDAYGLAETAYETELVGGSAGFIRGYDRSKWVAEKICRIAKDRGVAVTTYRIGFLSGNSGSGIHNKMDPMAQLFAVILGAGMTFHLDALLHLTPVDFCSLALVKLSLKPEAAGQIFHLVQENPLTYMQVVAWLQDEGYRVDVVDFPQWYEGLKKFCEFDPSYLPLFFLFGLKKQKPFGEDENIARLQYDCSNTNRYLEPVYQCPKMHRTMLKAYFDCIMASQRAHLVGSGDRSQAAS